MDDSSVDKSEHSSLNNINNEIFIQKAVKSNIEDCLQARPIKVAPLTPADYDRGLTVSELVLKNSEIKSGDIVVVTSKIVSILEGRCRQISDVQVSTKSKLLAKAYNLKPEMVEMVRREGKVYAVIPIKRMMKNRGAAKILLSQNLDSITTQDVDKIINSFQNMFIVKKFGFGADSAGIDTSNLPLGTLALLPESPGDSAKKIRKEIKDKTGFDVAVIITDTLGSRPNIMGSWDVPLGFAGIDPLERNGGATDLFGRMTPGGKSNFIFPLAALGGLVMGNCDECTPIAIISGYQYKSPPAESDFTTTESISVPSNILRATIFWSVIYTLRFYYENIKASIISRFM